MTLTAIILIVWAHWFGDFILQTDYIAQNKSKSNVILCEHIVLYVIPLVLIGFVIPISLAWLLINAIAHFSIDYVTSRITSNLWQKKKVHWFFVTIGADQALHMTTLLASYGLLLPYMV